MKDKKKVVFLLAAVAGIWGVIGWKVYEALLSDDNVAYNYAVTKTKPVELPTYEGYELLLDYNDPFLGKTRAVRRGRSTQSVSKTTKTRPSTKTNQPKQPEKEINWSVVKYHGVVINPRTNQKTASFIINGKDYILNQGEEAEGFKLEAIAGDSVKVSTQGNSKYVRIGGS